eukprot:TRINITY_DN540_c0_g1_i4.p1 TRINITY_DN540_c0_g1~~TRINITY_DN540_c0_g1_i4.p1  ORF type:complete len:166 (-),score=37.24 TRINITY_DN540_c0_g1_i4:74-571(-)
MCIRDRSTWEQQKANILFKIMKSIIFCLLISMIFCANNLRQSMLQEYQEETRNYEDFGNINQCKIAKCIKSNQVGRWAILYQEYSDKFNQNQQECFYHCQIEVCKKKSAQPSACEQDENGKKYEQIFDESQPGFRDYAPSKEDLQSNYKIDNNEEVAKFIENHHW